MIFAVPNTNKCWWCGNNADSGEHKIKKTDFTSTFGRGSYINKGQQPLLIKNGKQIPIQGPNSKFIKFANCLCHSCNTKKSSEFDKAYSIFIEFVLNSFEKVVLNGGIDTREIFGKDWETKKADVFRYYVKHIACQAATGSYEVSSNLVGFLNGTEDLEDVNFLFQVRTYNYLLSEMLKSSGSNYETLFLGNVRFFSESGYPANAIKSLTGWYTKNWFSTNYLYEKRILKKLNSSRGSFLTNPFIPFEIVDFRDMPSLGHLTDNMKIFEKIEDFDRGATLEEGWVFLEKMRNYKGVSNEVVQ